MSLAFEVTGEQIRKMRGDTPQVKFAEWLSESLGRKYNASLVSSWENGKRAVPNVVQLWLHMHSRGATIREKEPPRVISIANHKGGVGKTTTCVNLGFALSMAGHRVLLIDADQQSNLTFAAGMVGLDRHNYGKAHVAGVYDAIMGHVGIEDAIHRTQYPRLDIVPASPQLAQAEPELMMDPTGAWALRSALIPEKIEQYDFILIDCPPTLGLMTFAALVSSTEVLLTSGTNSLSTRGLPYMIKSIGRAKKINEPLRILGVLPTIYVAQQIQDREALEELCGVMDGYNIPVFDPIPRAAIYDQCVAGTRIAVDVDPQHSSTMAYLSLAHTLS